MHEEQARVVPHPFFLHWHESALERGTFWKQEAHVALSWLVVKKEEPSQAVKDPILRSINLFLTDSKG